MRLAITILIFIYTSNLSFGKSVSLLDYGLSEAKTGEDRFWVLYNAHSEAIKKHCTINYSITRNLEIEIPANAKSIPISERTDFNGLTLHVKNTKKQNFCLFSLETKSKDIDIKKESFRTLDFSTYPELRKGLVMLIVHDDTPWVEKRIGVNYGAIRYDVLLLKNGHALNYPVASYATDASVPKCSFVVTTSEYKYFRNISFYRDESSTHKTFLLSVKNQNNIEVKDVKLFTPENETLYGDQIISFDNCANVSLRRIIVENTYSNKDQFGYAFKLYNVWNCNVRDVVADAPWGIFGNNNINRATVKNCNINRFDLHCYGRDYYFENCTITSGIPIGSFQGTMSFKNCYFKGASPCLYRYDYNAYMPFNLEFEQCVVEMDKTHHWFMYYSQLSENAHKRKELNKKNLPNIKIKNCNVKLMEDVTSFDIVYMGRNYYQSPLSGIEDISIDGLTVIGKCEEVRIITNQTKTTNQVGLKIDNLSFDKNCSPKIVVNLKDRNGKSARLNVNRTLLNRIRIDN